MKILLVAVLAGMGVPFVAEATADGGVDIGTILVSYGVAAPFAYLCFWMLRRTQDELAAERAKSAALHQAAVDRERDFVSRLAPLLYDGALLYKQGNERLTSGIASSSDDRELHELKASVDELLRRMGEDQ